MKFITAITLGLIFFSTNVRPTFDHDHQQWAQVLKGHLSWHGDQSLVDYETLKKDPSTLNQYLVTLSRVTTSKYKQFSRKQKLAFLINSYNAFTLKLIITNYPLKSIKDIGNFLSGPWDKDFITLLGKKVNLNNIEHDMIRKDFKEPRIHFAVNCASMGCPNLSEKPFRAADLDEHLESMTQKFMQDKSKNFYNSKKKRLFLSKIFKWYGDDFEKHYTGGLDNFLSQHLGESDQEKRLIKQGKVSKKSLAYDWSLNDAK